MAEFPRIKHLPGSHAAPDDLVMTPDEAAHFFQGPVVVLEKMDGLNVAVNVRNGVLNARLKPAWRGALGGAVERAIRIHLWQHRDALHALLDGGGTAYGEWLWHRLSVDYSALNDVMQWFALGSPRGGLLLWDEATPRLHRAGLNVVTPLWRGELRDTRQVRTLVAQSAQGVRRMEGLILEHTGAHAIRHAKWVEHSYRHVETGVLPGTRNRLRGHVTADRRR